MIVSDDRVKFVGYTPSTRRNNVLFLRLNYAPRVYTLASIPTRTGGLVGIIIGRSWLPPHKATLLHSKQGKKVCHIVPIPIKYGMLPDLPHC